MVKQQKERRSKRAIVGFVSLIAAVAVIVGVGYAYFSDVITGSGTATAGTLDITGSITATKTFDGSAQNTSEDVTSGDVNFNPGDAIEVFPHGGVTNNGNKSAWVRETLTIGDISNTANVSDVADTNGDLASYLFVCVGTATQDQLMTAAAASGRTAGSALAPTGSTCTLATSGATFSTDPVVINGVGTAEAETETAAPTGATLVNSNKWMKTTTTPTITLFFDPLAPNAAQLGDVDYTVAVQALQFRNNSAALPTETQWETVVKDEFTL